MAGIRLGSDLFCSPQIERNFLRLSHISSPLWHCNMCETPLAGYPQSLGHVWEGHELLVAIDFPMGSSLGASLADHLRCLEGGFWCPILERSNILRCGISCGVCIFCASGLGGVCVLLNGSLSIESLCLVENLLPSSVFISPSGDVETLVKSIQVLSWMLWDCSFGNPDFWSSLHLYFSAVLYYIFSADHFSIGLVWSSWWNFTSIQYHVSEDFRILWWIADMRSKWLEKYKYLFCCSLHFYCIQAIVCYRYCAF